MLGICLVLSHLGYIFLNSHSMSDNVSPSDGKITPEIKVEVTESATTPANPEQGGAGEETPVKNEAGTPEVKPEEGVNAKAGYVIEKLGNEKKAAYQELIGLAKNNEAARQTVKAKLLSDPAMDKYVKSKFGEDYDLIMADEPAPKAVVPEIDLEKIREEERIKAKADILETQVRAAEQKELDQKAIEFGFNTDEREKFKVAVEALRGTETDEEALYRKAALVVNDEKANAQPARPTVPSGGEAPKPEVKTVRMSQAMVEVAKNTAQSVEEFAKDIARVEEMHGLNDKGQKALILPGLKNISPN